MGKLVRRALCVCTCVVVFMVIHSFCNCFAAEAPGCTPVSGAIHNLNVMNNSWYRQMDKGAQAPVSSLSQESNIKGADSTVAQDTRPKPIQRDMQFEYELSLAADQLLRDKAQEQSEEHPEALQEQERSLSPDATFMVSYNEDVTLKTIEVRDTQGTALARYTVQQQRNSPLVTLVRDDGCAIQLLLDKETLAATIRMLTIPAGASRKELTAGLGPVIAFMGYHLEDGANNAG